MIVTSSKAFATDLRGAEGVSSSAHKVHAEIRTRVSTYYTALCPPLARGAVLGFGLCSESLRLNGTGWKRRHPGFE